LGWTVGRNLRIDYRWGAMDADRARRYAPELVALAPDVILAVGAPAVVALQQAARAVPMVFVNIVDPVGAGFVDSLAQPGGNLTGLLHYEEGIVGKWLALLKEIAPGLTRTALMADPKSPVYDYFVRSANARVKLQNGGAVEGDIFHRSLSIDENSQFEGSSRRVENPTDLSSSVDAKGPQKKDVAPAPLPSI
jgi:hypothetical protein